MYTGFATQLWRCGGRDFEPDGRAAFADAQAVAATAAFIHALRDAGPVDWTDQRWCELARDFGRGRYQGRDVAEALRAAATEAEQRFAARD